METEDDETNDSSPVYCEYTFIVPLPNITRTHSTEGKWFSKLKAIKIKQWYYLEMSVDG